MPEIASPIPSNAIVESAFSQLDALSYWEQRLFFHKRIPNQYPRFFYKYFSYDPGNPDAIRNLRSVLVESKFWLANHESFNDPFDLKANVVFSGTEYEKKSRLKSLIANQNPHAPRKERKKILEHMMARSDADWDESIKKIFNARSKQIGVCSFASDTKPHIGTSNRSRNTTFRLGPRSILMWAHYGRNHSGVSLQFETIRDYRTFTVANEVEYSEDYPRVDYIKNFEDNILLPLIRKHKGWEYENEWRILHMTGAEQLFPFKPNALRRIIFGCRASPEVFAGIEELLNEREKNGLPTIDLYRAVQHPTDYKLMLWRINPRRTQ